MLFKRVFPLIVVLIIVLTGCLGKTEVMAPGEEVIKDPLDLIPGDIGLIARADMYELLETFNEDLNLPDFEVDPGAVDIIYIYDKDPGLDDIFNLLRGKVFKSAALEGDFRGVEEGWEELGSGIYLSPDSRRAYNGGVLLLGEFDLEETTGGLRGSDIEKKLDDMGEAAVVTVVKYDGRLKDDVTIALEKLPASLKMDGVVFLGFGIDMIEGEMVHLKLKLYTTNTSHAEKMSQTLKTTVSLAEKTNQLPQSLSFLADVSFDRERNIIILEGEITREEFLKLLE